MGIKLFGKVSNVKTCDFEQNSQKCLLRQIIYGFKISFVFVEQNLCYTLNDYCIKFKFQI